MAWRKKTAVPDTDATAFVLEALQFTGLPPATTIQEPCLAEPLVKGGGWAQHTTQAVVRAGGHCSALAQGSRQGARNPFLLQDIGQGKASRALPLSESCHSRWKHHLQPKYENEVALWTLGPVKRIVGLEPEFNLEFGEQQGG